MTEFWTTSAVDTAHVAAHARRLEAEGWDGVTYTDSQNLHGEVYVSMTLAALATKDLRIASGVTNPLTRHPAVAAAAAATLSVVSDNRFELGLGRGDSALAHLGLAPCSVSYLERYLDVLQSYLRGDGVAIDEARAMAAGARDGVVKPLSSLHLHEQPSASQLKWVSSLEGPKVPVFVTASGPKVLKAAAAKCDRVALVVGADPERLKSAIAIVRSVREDVRISAYVDVFVGTPEDAISRGGGRLATHARFSAMHGSVSLPASSGLSTVLERVAHQYDMTAHAKDGASQTTVLTPAFANEFAIVGDASYCADRLRELSTMGIDRFHIWGYPVDHLLNDFDPFASTVLPLLS